MKESENINRYPNDSSNKHYLALEIDKVLLRLSKFAQSKIGAASCLNLKAFSQKAQIEYALILVDEAKKIIDDTQTLPEIGEIIDIEALFNKRYFDAYDIIEMTKSLRSARLCKNFISKNDTKNLIELSSKFYTNKELEDEVFSIFDSELNVVDSASDTLKSLRNSYNDNKENLKQAVNNLLRNPAFVENLQDTVVTTRDNRPVFQVKASNKNKVQGIIHDISSTNLTYFIEPAVLVPLSNKLRQIEIEIKAEIERILSCLSLKFKDIYPELLENKKILTKLDVIFAKARYSIHLKAQSAQIVEEKIIDIQQMAHPLLLDVKEEVVKNDVNLGINYGCLLITGSNTGGKTVAIKTLGLLVLMTEMGLHIPCLGAKIHPFKEIYCDISSEQSIEQGFSTFSASIGNIADILNNINENSLVLLDELGSGTDPIEGAALGRAILEFIFSCKAKAMVTTHLGELKALKFENESGYFENATVQFDITTLKPKYNLIIGVSGTSNAIDISSQLGLDETVILRAKELLTNGSSSNKMFLEIENINQSLAKKEEQTKQNLEVINKTKGELETKLEDLKKNKKKSLDNFKKKFQSQLDDARSEIKQIVDEIRKEKSLKVAMRSYNRLNAIESKIREDFTTVDDELAKKYTDIDLKSLKIGQNVLIKKLNQVVILDSLPDKKGNVNVRIGNITSKIHISKLAKTDKKIAPLLKKTSVSFDNTDNLLSRLDLRGMRVIDAIEYLDEKLDKASLRGLNQITVIHGFGTGALKQAVADYLKESPYVAKYHYGDETQGRDGVVIIDLL